MKKRSRPHIPGGSPSGLNPRPDQPRWLIWVLFLLSALFLRGLGHGFVNFDDDLYVTDNLQVQHGWTLAGLRWAFYGSAAANWHPLTWLSHMTDCQFFGLKPWGPHLVNALFHAANTGLLFYVLKGMTGAVWRSFFVAAIFAVHPLHVESVAWISERKDVLSGFFFLLTLLAYVRYVRERSATGPRAVPGSQQPRQAGATQASPGLPLRSNALRARDGSRSVPFAVHYIVSLGCFALGLMSKPMLVTVPFLLLLLDYWPLRRIGEGEPGMSSRFGQLGAWAKLVWEKAPFFALTAGSSLITYLVQNRAGAMWTLAEVPLPARIGNALVSYWRYLAKSFWPVRLSIFYPHPGEWSMGVVLAAGLSLVAVTVIVFRLRRRAPFMMVGWLWFLGMLVPVIGLVQVGWQSLADRYMYLPMIGLLLVVVWGTESLARERLATIGPLRAISAGLVGVSGLLTWQQLGYWKNSESLFGHAVSVTQNNFVAHHNLGMALMARGQLEAARQEFREAVRLRPRSADSYNGLGEVLLRQGRLDEGQTLFEQAIALKPDLAVAHNNLGIILSRKGSPDAAAAQFEAAIKARPGYTKAFINLGLALQASGRLEEATQKLQRAVGLAPEDAEARKSLGMALGRSGRMEEAVQQLGIALKINPEDSQTCHNLGLACLRLGRAPEAIVQFERALKLKADSAETHAYLGMALAQVNRQAEAADHVREALKLKPNDPQLEQQLQTLTGEARH